MQIKQSNVIEAPVVKNTDINASTPAGLSEPSYLYSLEPIGVGTPLVEGLQSYVVRLAQAHCVTPRTLFQEAVFPWLFPDKDARYMQNYTSSIRFRAFVFNGMSPIVASMVEALESLTLQSGLCFLTMLPWREGISPLGMMRKKKAWCVECYREWIMRKQKLYEPLLWSIAQVEVCPIHGTYLDSCCRTCGAEQPILAGYTPSGYCVSCRSVLVANPCVVPNSEEPGSRKGFMGDIWVAEQVGRLLAASPYIQPDRVFAPMEDVFKTLVTCQKYGERKRTASKLGVHKDNLRTYSQRRDRKPSLMQLLRPCKNANLSVLDFLTGISDYQNIDVSKISVDVSPTKPGKAAPLSIKEVREYLQNALLSDADAHVGITEHARRIGCSREVLHRRFPAFCQALTKRSREYRAMAREKMLNSLIEQARAATLQIYAAGEYPSASRVSAYLQRAGCMRIPVVQAMWRETLGQLELR